MPVVTCILGTSNFCTSPHGFLWSPGLLLCQSAESFTKLWYGEAHREQLWWGPRLRFQASFVSFHRFTVSPQNFWSFLLVKWIMGRSRGYTKDVASLFGQLLVPQEAGFSEAPFDRFLDIVESFAEHQAEMNPCNIYCTYHDSWLITIIIINQ